ncbi:conserved hypothetical protein [Microbacterium sp. 8M]|uniref:DUF4238 domain-containing protein n=1 Tax=Microbacterium sp. 8M TaxID=2653153 RepID=UPI0012F007AF|nr:DUF4238 domain-containing protein [Microbacterium sp. 8M]VXA98726.1 conserved hypothetical protein [Microbacterium sp. 8M]
MSPTAKRHHHVPQFYLRGFADDDQITTVRLPGDRTYTASVRKTAAENGFYTVPGHQAGDDVFERLFSEVEGAAAPVFRKLGEGVWPLEVQDRATLASLIALQVTRGPEQRRNMQHMKARLTQIELSMVGRDGVKDWAKKRSGLVIDDATAELIWEQAMRTDGPPVSVTAIDHIIQIGEMTEALMPYIAGRPWTLVRFDRRSLITSDTPVVLVPNPDETEDEGDEAFLPQGIGFLNAWGITYPLTRKLGLLMSDPMVLADRVDVNRVARGEFDHAEQGTTQYERFFNLHTAMNASISLFHHPDDARFVPEALPDPDPVTMRMSGGPAPYHDDDRVAAARKAPPQ